MPVLTSSRAVCVSRLAVGLVPLAMLLSACQSSSRFGTILPDDDGYRPAARQSSPPPPLMPAPSSEVESGDLPPPPGGAQMASPAPYPGTSAGAGVSPPGAPIYPAPDSAPAGTNPGLPPPRVATAPVPSAPASAPTVTSMIGNWQVSEAAGGRCRITLSSAPKLDLYGAATNGCQNKDLQRVNAWAVSGSEVILYEPAGGVVARLRQGGGGYSGVTLKSGAPVSLSK